MVAMDYTELILAMFLTRIGFIEQREMLKGTSAI